MNIAAYCRVSTDKEDQLNSLETQKEFFLEYTKRTGDNLIKLYADEGISGTKIKNRKEFQRMLADAEKGLFDMVVVKDISRFARNTVDLLQSVRKLKALGIETQFLTANMTSMGNSEFVLTIFGALAQEESANTSKRIKFGKKVNAEKGRVPNIVYGYDKTIGDYFNLSINEQETSVIRQMYKWYTEEGFGGAKIANMLNERGIKTKRGNNWSQNSVCRILTNEIYTGKIINGKEEIADFLIFQYVFLLFCKLQKSHQFLTEFAHIHFHRYSNLHIVLIFYPYSKEICNCCLFLPSSSRSFLAFTSSCKAPISAGSQFLFFSARLSCLMRIKASENALCCSSFVSRWIVALKREATSFST